MALEAARIFDRVGCDVRVFDPSGLPVKDDVQHNHPKVQELRNLSIWSEAQFWCSPEQHGNITAVMKNQIDWIPLSTGSVRPTQGRVLGFAQVRALRPATCPVMTPLLKLMDVGVQINGGSQSFNTVNTLRILGRWMRMFVIPNQVCMS
jgi:arsenic resistance protein ArsH